MAINASETYPQVLLTSGGNSDALGLESGKFLVYMIRSLQHILIDDIINIGNLDCPVTKIAGMSEFGKIRGWCTLDPMVCKNMTPAQNWKQFRRCKFYEALMKYILGDNLDRIDFI